MKTRFNASYTANNENLKVNDVVYIVDHSPQHNKHHIATVERVLKSKIEVSYQHNDEKKILTFKKDGYEVTSSISTRFYKTVRPYNDLTVQECEAEKKRFEEAITNKQAFVRCRTMIEKLQRMSVYANNWSEIEQMLKTIDCLKD